MSLKQKGWVWGIAMAVILSFHDLTAKYATQGLPPVALTFVIAAIAACVLILLRIIVQRGFRIPHAPLSSWFRLWLVGALASTGGFLLFYWALTRGTVTEAAVISQLEAAFTALFGFLFLRERLTKRQTGGLVLAIAAAVVFSAGNTWEFTATSVAFLGAVIIWGYTNILVRPILRHFDALLIAAGRYGFGALAVTPLLIGTQIIPSADRHLLWTVANAVILGVGVACLYQSMKLSRTVAEATMWYLPMTIGASILGAVFFGDRLSVIQYFAAVGILIGVWLVVRGEEENGLIMER